MTLIERDFKTNPKDVCAACYGAQQSISVDVWHESQFEQFTPKTCSYVISERECSVCVYDVFTQCERIISKKKTIKISLYCKKKNNLKQNK